MWRASHGGSRSPWRSSALSDASDQAHQRPRPCGAGRRWVLPTSVRARARDGDQQGQGPPTGWRPAACLGPPTRARANGRGMDTSRDRDRLRDGDLSPAWDRPHGRSGLGTGEGDYSLPGQRVGPRSRVQGCGGQSQSATPAARGIAVLHWPSCGIQGRAPPRDRAAGLAWGARDRAPVASGRTACGTGLSGSRHHAAAQRGRLVQKQGVGPCWRLLVAVQGTRGG